MAEQIWQIENEEIVWKVKNGISHFDDIEMSGLFADQIVYYGVAENGELTLSQKCYFPTLRTIPNNTHATFCFNINNSERPKILKNGTTVKEYPVEFRFNGVLKVVCNTDSGFTTERCLFPASNSKCTVELITVRATEELELSLSLPSGHVHSYGRGTKGVYVSRICNDTCDGLWLEPNTEITFGIYYSALLASDIPTIPDGREELKKRLERIDSLCNGALVLKSGNAELDTMTRFAKLRAGESIFETLTGKYHSPGGHAYYAAIWCNDEIEYAGPHFAMTGDKTAIEASLNAYRAYIPFMSESFERLPSSIIAEGLDIWEGAGDRGDAAMYLYGASLFCLYLGDKEIATELYGAIKWCAEYCERKKSPEGVICSDSDELEGRFPTDRHANLSTSSLCYGGLLFASKLARSLGDEANAILFADRADALALAIESYFGAELHGFNTYRYSKGFDTLRAWICLPLCMGITNRAEGTLDAMLSPYLWTEEGMLTCERSAENTSDTIWDRSTLYGFKCAFLSGKGNRMLKPLLDYCRKRLLCDRVPYAVEAYPEGDKRHLSGESALFVRVITEGIFGIMPESLTSFSFVPRLPDGIPEISLERIYICGKCIDIKINSESFEVFVNGTLAEKGITNGERIVVETKQN
ncbi:MAG: hypothetical protein IJO64_00455 [Clostridia bacterium]|nr:hypothetical protein [Clostridia bacterium]